VQKYFHEKISEMHGNVENLSNSLKQLRSKLKESVDSLVKTQDIFLSQAKVDKILQYRYNYEEK